MTVDRIPALLEPIQERLDAITPGKWFREYSDVITNDPDPRDVEEGYDDPRSMRIVRAAPHLNKREPQGIKNADFIANAPTDTARLLAAVKAVAEVHKPAKVQRTKYNADGTLISYTVTEDGPCVVCYPPFITQHCEECEDYDETCGGVTGAASRPWPCPTVSAVEAALRGEA